MLTVPQPSPFPALIAEARADSHVAALVGDRVRGARPRPGDIKGPGEYQAFVVFSSLSVPPHISLPVTFAEFAMNAYGVTDENAWAVYAAIVKTFHAVRTRTKSNGLGIFQSLVVTGGFQDVDPDTSQPVVRGTVRLVATTIAV